jgi:hypothetical protein
MGIISKGILGGFSGSVGPIVGASWNGISYIRSKPYPARRISSPAQVIQQARFSLMVRYLKPLNSLLALGFGRAAKGMTGLNLAVRYNVLNAVSGTYPDFAIDHAMLKLSRGWLFNVEEPESVSTGKGTISFTWRDNSGMGRACPGDRAVLVACDPTLPQAVYKCFGARRSEQADTLSVPFSSGTEVETYIFFIAGNGMASDSMHTGTITVL